MSITDKDKVDIVSTDKSGKKVFLTIADHLDWTDELFHLNALQDKLNAYISFIEDGQVFESYPAAIDKKLIISIANKYEIPANGIAFLEIVKGVLYDLDVELEY